MLRGQLTARGVGILAAAVTAIAASVTATLWSAGGCNSGPNCNTGASDFPPVTCSSDEKCCLIGNERDGCVKGKVCPRLIGCGGVAPFANTCLGGYCLLTYAQPADDAAPPTAGDGGAGDTGVSDGGVGSHDAGGSVDAAVRIDAAGPPACLYAGECTAGCSPDKRCGSGYCCGAGTHCEGTCCVAN